MPREAATRELLYAANHPELPAAHLQKPCEPWEPDVAETAYAAGVYLQSSPEPGKETLLPSSVLLAPSADKA